MDASRMRRLALLRGAALLVIIMAGLGMNLVSSAIPAKAKGENLTSYPAQGPNNGTNPLNYHGDPVITNPQAYLIFEDDSSDSYWGQSLNGGSQTNMQRVQQYFADVSGSNFEGILTQYYDTDSSGTKHSISNTISMSGIALDTNFSYSNECTSAKELYDPAPVHPPTI